MYRLSKEGQGDISFIAQGTISYFEIYKSKPRITYLLIAANIFLLFALYHALCIFLIFIISLSFDRSVTKNDIGDKKRYAINL